MNWKLSDKKNEKQLLIIGKKIYIKMKKNTRAVICLLNLVDMKYCLLLLVAVIFSACSEQVEPEDKYVLRPIDEYLEYKLFYLLGRK